MTAQVQPPAALRLQVTTAPAIEPAALPPNVPAIVEVVVKAVALVVVVVVALALTAIGLLMLVIVDPVKPTSHSPMPKLPSLIQFSTEVLTAPNSATARVICVLAVYC